MPLPITGIIAFIRSPLAKWIGISVAIASLAFGAYMVIDNRGYSRCTTDTQLDYLHKAEEAHQVYLAEVERGEVLSAELAKTQRKLYETKSEYLAYANSIVGHCPAELGMFLSQPYPANSEAPKATSVPVDTDATVAASLIAANIAENRFRFEANFAQCFTLIKWHEEAMK